MHRHCNGSESLCLARIRLARLIIDDQYGREIKSSSQEWMGYQIEPPPKQKIEANVNQASSEVVENDLATDLQRNER